MSHYIKLNASAEPPRLLPTLNLATIEGYRGKTSQPRYYPFRGLAKGLIKHAMADGFTAIQSHLLFPCRLTPFINHDLPCYKAAIIQVHKLEAAVMHWRKKGFGAATIIVGQGGETEQACIRQAQAITDIADRLNFPIALELHRASISENIQHCLAMVEACPAIRFNADFSHYLMAYQLDRCSSEDLAALLLLMRPIFERVIFFHLRYADHTAIQLAQPNDRAKQVYQAMCFEVFQVFKQTASPGDVLPIAPELLSPLTGYCEVERQSTGQIPQGNHYQQALNLIADMQNLFAQNTLTLKEYPAEIAPGIDHHIKDKGAFDAFVVKQSYAGKTRYVVSLGSALWPNQNQDLVKRFATLQTQYPQLVLAISRNTALHTLVDCESCIKAYPSLRFSLNIRELLLSREPKPQHLPGLYKRVKALAAYIVHSPADFSTAEYQFDPVNYHWAAYFRPGLSVISQIIEGIYAIFCRKIHRLLSE